MRSAKRDKSLISYTYVDISELTYANIIPHSAIHFILKYSWKRKDEHMLVNIRARKKNQTNQSHHWASI